MHRQTLLGVCLGVLGGLLVSSSSARAQGPSAIAGAVRDTSGGALPGVTVEAASPALIEKVRTVITDGEGRYNIVDLRPGTYAVTFTLPGFNTFKRDGIALTSGFTATVNADMQVGSLEETITVSGEAPLVDTQNARQQKVVSDEVLAALPTGQTNVVSLIALTPGMTGNASVGGSTGAYHGQQTKGTFHGKRGSHIRYDGMRIDNYAGSGDSPGYLFNVQTVEETVVETGGAQAESGTPNVLMNMVPKEGANTFRFGVSGMFTNRSMQSANLSDELIARGLKVVPKVDRMYDAGFTVGGPISQDKVWFFAAIRRWGTKNQAANLFWNKTQGTPFYTPDPDRPAFRDERYASHASRITWQVSPRNKLNVFVDVKKDCICETGGAGSALGSGATNAREAVLTWDLWPNGLIQGTWSSPLTSKLLLEAGASVVFFHWPGDLPEGVSPNHVSILEQSTNFRYNSAGGVFQPDRRVGDRYAQRFAMSYVTGSHALKMGVQIDQGYSDQKIEPVGLSVAPGISYIFNRGVPVSLQYDVAPRRETYYQKAEMGIYAQDQWTLKRLTVNGGLRFDYYNGYIPETVRPAGAFWPEARFDAVHGAPAWSDINPRLGVAYDLFGNGRTAIKGSFGRYVEMTANWHVSQYHPLNTSVNSTTRAWTDTNGNYTPDCDLANFATNGECGGIANLNFGKVNPNATRFADDVRTGFGSRLYTWDMATELQHQISSGVSVTAGYYHNWAGDFAVTDNVLVTPADFSPYCITAPADARLPGGGGYQVCGLYDINPDKFGQVQNVVTLSDNFGKQKRISDFVAVNLEARLGEGFRLSAGIDTGRTKDEACFNVDSPSAVPGNLPGIQYPLYGWNGPSPHAGTTVNGKATCAATIPLAGNTQFKMNGSYPLPADFMLAGTYQNVPGSPWLATYNATTAEIAPSLGRNLSGGVRTAAVALLNPHTEREDRRHQVDLRVSKIFRFGNKGRLQANLDLYNVLNANDVLGLNTNYGSNWLVPQSILPGRLLQLSGNWNF